MKCDCCGRPGWGGWGACAACHRWASRVMVELGRGARAVAHPGYVPENDPDPSDPYGAPDE